MQPMLSFIVPAYNEELELPSAIQAIQKAAGRTGDAFEIIVADDASTDATAKMAASMGARVIPINRRQIAAARNAGARASSGEILFFVDADTQINSKHVTGAIATLKAGYSGGSAYVHPDGLVPLWGRLFVKVFSFFYFRLGFGAGAFLFTTRRNFDAVGGFDEQYFMGEEVYFSLALRKLGPFRVLKEPVLTSGRKLRMYSGRYVLARSLSIILRGPKGARSREGLDLWYNGRRETGGSKMSER